MLPENYYKERLEILHKQLSKLTRKKSRLGWLRFTVVIALIFFIYIFWSAGLIYVIPVSLLLLTGFIKMVFIDINNNNLIAHTKVLIEINEDEIKSLEGNYHHFPAGNEFIPKEHLYANDLNIFGRASLSQ